MEQSDSQCLLKTCEEEELDTHRHTESVYRNSVPQNKKLNIQHQLYCFHILVTLLLLGSKH